MSNFKIINSQLFAAGLGVKFAAATEFDFAAGLQLPEFAAGGRPIEHMFGPSSKGTNVRRTNVRSSVLWG